MKKSPVVHFEVPYKDQNRVSEFYSKTFGWDMQGLGSEMGDYITAETTEIDPGTQRPKESGAINGGFFLKTAENQYPSVVIAVDDIYEAMERVKASGGTVIGAQKSGEPDNIPGVGLYISILDSEDNRLSLLQPEMSGSKPPEQNE